MSTEPPRQPGWLASPIWPRCAPFIVYMLFIMIESFTGDRRLLGIDAHGWYFVQVVLTAAVLLAYWRTYSELRTTDFPVRQLVLGITVGVVVLIIWRALDQPWATIGSDRPIQGARTLLATEPLYATARIVGAVLIVPVMEELFWRSFILRWTHRSDFLAVRPADISLRAVLISSVLFALEHHLILAGLAAGLAYAELYRRTGRLWTVIVAHAVTNLLIEIIGTK